MDGILNINKPAGMTSYRVVAAVKRLSSEKRVGHAGTLDPDATGVLPVCLGKGTRVIEFLVDTVKIYRADIILGTATDTYDASGTVTGGGDPSGIGREQVEEVLPVFRGTISQTPPMYSALKHKGQPLYELARAGITIERKPRKVTIHRLDLVDWHSPCLTIEVECSKGTYIRSLAHDIGQSLGCGAHLSRLERTRCGIFDISASIALPALEEAFRAGNASDYLLPIDYVLGHLGTITVTDEEAAAIATGKKLPLATAPSSPGEVYRAYTRDNRFLAILKYLPEEAAWQPVKVFV